MASRSGCSLRCRWSLALKVLIIVSFEGRTTLARRSRNSKVTPLTMLETRPEGSMSVTGTEEVPSASASSTHAKTEPASRFGTRLAALLCAPLAGTSLRNAFCGTSAKYSSGEVTDTASTATWPVSNAIYLVGLAAIVVLALQAVKKSRARARSTISTSEGASISATCINLCKNMIGAGLLNVCIAFMYSSVLGGLLAMMFSLFVSLSGFLLIGFCCDKYGALSFRELWRKAMGTQTEKIVDLALFFHTLFSCVGYITLIGDFATKSASGLAPGSLFENRGFSVGVIVLSIIFPLCLLKDLKSLKFTSGLGLAITALACLYVFGEALGHSDTLLLTLQDKWWYANRDIFKTIALFNGSFSAHYNAPTFYAELADRSFKRFAQCALISFGIGATLFTVFGLVGYGRFGDEVMGNVLKGYDSNKVVVQLCWLAMGLSTVFVYPHAFQRMRSSFNALLDKHEHAHFLPTTAGLLAANVIGGILFTDIAVVKMIKGATLGTSLMFIFPGLFYINLSAQGSGIIKKHFGENQALGYYLSVLLIAVGFACGVLAVLIHYKLL